jgi:hypothetical protein
MQPVADRLRSYPRNQTRYMTRRATASGQPELTEHGVFGAFPPSPSAFIVTLQVTLAWTFTGFAPPIHASPVMNAVHAGHDVTLRFGLGGVDEAVPSMLGTASSLDDVRCSAPISPKDHALEERSARSGGRRERDPCSRFPCASGPADHAERCRLR